MMRFNIGILFLIFCAGCIFFFSTPLWEATLEEPSIVSKNSFIFPTPLAPADSLNNIDLIQNFISSNFLSYPNAQILPKETITLTAELQDGDTLYSLLTHYGIPNNEIFIISNLFASFYNPRLIRKNHPFHLTFRNQQLEKILFSLSASKILHIERTQDNTFTSRVEHVSLLTEVIRIDGIVQFNLFDSALQANIPQSIILQMLDILAFKIDFQRHIFPQDTFSILFEQKINPKGNIVGYGNILSVFITARKKLLQFYRYNNTHNHVDYYSEKGLSIRSFLMKRPVANARISSTFGMRLHPILGYSKFHQGVDFAAPTGTPIYSAGNGIIEEMKFSPTYGNYIKVRHNKTYQTLYAHMHHFHKGLKKNSRVKQGEIIGYVGTTGRSSGPHLHYEVRKNKKPLDPLTLDNPSNQILPPHEMILFKEKLSDYNELYQSLAPGKNKKDLHVPDSPSS